jgi:hypothetical protein
MAHEVPQVPFEGEVESTPAEDPIAAGVTNVDDLGLWIVPDPPARAA